MLQEYIRFKFVLQVNKVLWTLYKEISWLKFYKIEPRGDMPFTGMVIHKKPPSKIKKTHRLWKSGEHLFHSIFGFVKKDNGCKGNRKG